MFFLSVSSALATTDKLFFALGRTQSSNVSWPATWRGLRRIWPNPFSRWTHQGDREFWFLLRCWTERNDLLAIKFDASYIKPIYYKTFIFCLFLCKVCSTTTSQSIRRTVNKTHGQPRPLRCDVAISPKPPQTARINLRINLILFVVIRLRLTRSLSIKIHTCPRSMRFWNAFAWRLWRPVWSAAR